MAVHRFIRFHCRFFNAFQWKCVIFAQFTKISLEFFPIPQHDFPGSNSSDSRDEKKTDWKKILVCVRNNHIHARQSERALSEVGNEFRKMAMENHLNEKIKISRDFERKMDIICEQNKKRRVCHMSEKCQCFAHHFRSHIFVSHNDKC